MALLGFWGMGMGRIPDICIPSDRATVVTFDDQDDGLPSYAPYGIYPGTNDTIRWDAGDRSADTDSIIMGWWGRATGGTTTAYPFSIQHAGENSFLMLRANQSTEEIRVIYTTSLFGSSQVTLGAITPAGFDWNAWNFFELEWIPSTTSGLVRLRINGETPDGWTDVSGVQTAVLDSTNLGMNFWQRNGATWIGITSGLYSCDDSGGDLNELLGICRFPLLTVTSDVVSDFVGSDGNSVNNFALIDDAPGVIATMGDYVESSTAGDQQSCGVESLTALQTANVELQGPTRAVNLVAYATDPLAGTQDVVAGVISGVAQTTGTNTIQDDPDVGSVYQLVENDPATGLPWDDLALETMTALVEVPS